MNKLFGKLKAELIETDIPVIERLVDKINRNINPPERVKSDSVYIRAMYIVSDQVNSYGGRFPVDEHESLIEMLIDSPVMVGHRKDELPIARNFHAELVRRGEANWIKVYFYWLKEAENGEDLRKNIDGGIYKECSISFIFNFPECSICGEDIRECKHRPFGQYKEVDGTEMTAHFNYRQILKVLETSLVYRGSVRDTSITDELIFNKPDNTKLDIGSVQNWTDRKPQMIRRISDLESIDIGASYQIFPAYESIPVHLIKTDDTVTMRLVNGDLIESEPVRKHIDGLSLPDGDYQVEARLVGYRGKERQPAGQVLKYIKGEKSNVKRIELKVCHLVDDGTDMISRYERLEQIFEDRPELLIHTEIVAGNKLADLIGKYSTRLGTELINCTTNQLYHYTDKIIATLQVDSAEAKGGRYHYQCSGIINGKPVALSHNIISKIKFEPNEKIEIVAKGINLKDEHLCLSDYSIIANSNDVGYPVELSLLLDDPESGQGYYLNGIGDDELVLSLDDGTKQVHYLISNFSEASYCQNRRFLADFLDISARVNNDKPNGQVKSRKNEKGAILLDLTGDWTGRHVIRPIRLRGQIRSILYKVRTKGADNVRA